jgi:putative ABC transport system permease protein
MSWFTRLGNVFRRAKLSDDIDREIAFHLAERADELESSGLPSEAARREARRRFGNITLQHETTRERDLIPWLDSFFGDVRYALRAMRKAPGFALVAILSLALGIGANTAIFTLIDVTMLKSLPVRDPESLVLLTPAASGSKGRTFSRELWEQVRDHQNVFADVAVYGASNATLGTGGDARTVNVGLVGGDLFTMLGVRSIAGRTLVAGDDFRGCPLAAVVTGRFSQREFGESATAVGKAVVLDGQAYEVVGVTEPRFFGVEFGWDVPIWIPQCAERRSGSAGTAVGGLVLGRLKPGITLAQGRALVSTLDPRTFQKANADAASGTNGRTTFGIEPFSGGIPFLRERYGDALSLLMAVVCIVLLIACANIANLLLARATARRREIALRLALGASQRRIVRQLLTESMLLALLGAAGGLLFAAWGTQALVGLLSTTIALDLSPDVRVLAFTMAVATLTGIVFGLVPAWSAGRVDAQAALKAGDRITADGRPHFRFGRTVVVAQIALSLVMVAATGLLLGSWARLLAIDPGFRGDGVLLATVNAGAARIPADRRNELYERTLDRLRALPGVQSASAAWITPLSANARVLIDATGLTSTATTTLEARLNQVGQDYFTTIGTPIIAGRDFGASDLPQSPWIAIVNESFARRVYGSSAAVGRYFRVQRRTGLSEPIEIVGVVGDTKWGSIRDQNQPIVYYALSQMTLADASMNFALRVAGRADAIAPAVKTAIGEIDPRLPLKLVTLRQRIDDSIRVPRTLALLSGFFGGLALLLAMIGLYGVTSYTIGRRRNEIGVRLALGAARSKVVAMLVGETGWLVGIGAAAGLALTFGATRLVSSLLYGIKPTDPATLAVSVLSLVVLGLGAALVPARRAARMNPLAALRED